MPDTEEKLKKLDDKLNDQAKLFIKADIAIKKLSEDDNNLKDSSLEEFSLEMSKLLKDNIDHINKQKKELLDEE